MGNTIKGNVGELFVLSTGEIKEPKNLDKFHPQSNVNILVINIEGIPQEKTMAQINFAPTNKSGWASVWFPLNRKGVLHHKLENEDEYRTFTQYTIQVPEPITTLNLNNSSALNVGITFRHIGGIDFLGAYETIQDLIAEYPPYQDLSENLAVAYVYGTTNYGFYQVVFDNGVYVWQQTPSPIAQLQIKPYNMGNIQIQGGYGTRTPIQSIADSQYNLIWLELNTIASRLDLFYDKEHIDTAFLEKYTTPTGDNDVFSIYGITAQGQQAIYQASVENHDNTIVVRDGVGRIKDLDEHNISSEAHSNEFNKKVDKITQEQRDSLGFMENDDRIVPGVDGNLNEMPIKATAIKEKNTIVMRDSGGNFQDLYEHNTSQGAHQDIRNMIAALQGGIIPRGLLQYNSNDIRYDKTLLDTYIQNNYSREAQLGDMVRDLDNIEWYYNGEFWDELGPYSLIPLASPYNDGLMSNIDYKILSQLEADSAFYYNTHGIPVKIKFQKFQLAAGQTMDDALSTLPVIDYEAEGGYIPIIRYTFYDSDGNIVGESMGKKPITTGSGGAGLTPEQEAKLDIIKDDGDGTKFLADDGTYKEVGGGSIDEVDGATTPIMLKTGSQETLDEDETLKERELVYSSDKNIFGIYYDNQIRWQGVPLVVEPIIRVRNFGASDSKLSYVGVSPTLRLLQDGDINYYTNDIFDTMYPFRDMKEVEDELGNKFIEIPPFYVKYIVDENNIITGYDIANYKVDEDYGISQAFIDVISGEVKPLWFGKYMANVDGSNKMTSKSGVMATADQTLAGFRQRAINNGLGYYQNSIYTWQIVQMLMWTYFGSINSNDFFPDINYGSYLENGSMDNVPYKVAYNSTTGKNTFFGIENILKEKRHFIDGVLLNIPNMYVAKDFRKFATNTTTNYDLVSTSLPTGSSGFIVSMAYENGVMYPKVITGGSSSTHFANYYYSNTGNRILYGGSTRDSRAGSGLSYWCGGSYSSHSYASIGSRLMYSPLTPTEEE